MSKTPPSFDSDLFKFLKDLRQNNRRDWFLNNKERYEDEVKHPSLQFISDFGPHLRKISPNFTADPRPVGGSLFRIHRDVRFSKDKSPYKTFAGVQFRHEAGKDAHAPGYYLHLDPGNIFVGAGCWRPAREALESIRDAIVEDPDRWTEARDALVSAGFAFEGDSLKRPPRGYPPEHRQIGDLKRKDFIAVRHLSDEAVLAPDFVAAFAGMCSEAAPLMRFLTSAIGVRW